MRSTGPLQVFHKGTSPKQSAVTLLFNIYRYNYIYIFSYKYKSQTPASEKSGIIRKSYSYLNFEHFAVNLMNVEKNVPLITMYKCVMVTQRNMIAFCTM